MSVKLAAVATPKKSTLRSKYGKTQEKTNVVAGVDLSDNRINQVLVKNIPSEDKLNQIVEILTVDLESEEIIEASGKNVKLVKDMVRDLLSRFTAHNRKWQFDDSCGAPQHSGQTPSCGIY